MAFLVKSGKATQAGPSTPGFGLVEQWIHVRRPALLLPATTTQQLFQVRGGKILVHLLIGTVTVVLDATDPVGKISSKALNAAMTTAVGTAVDVASTVTWASLEVGGMLVVEGDGTAIVKSNAGAAFIGPNGGKWVAPNGEIYLTTGGTNLTGFVQWDIFYQPMDEGTTVVAMTSPVAAI